MSWGKWIEWNLFRDRFTFFSFGIERMAEKTSSGWTRTDSLEKLLFDRFKSSTECRNDIVSGKVFSRFEDRSSTLRDFKTDSLMICVHGMLLKPRFRVSRSGKKSSLMSISVMLLNYISRSRRPVKLLRCDNFSSFSLIFRETRFLK